MRQTRCDVIVRFGLSQTFLVCDSEQTHVKRLLSNECKTFHQRCPVPAYTLPTWAWARSLSFVQPALPGPPNLSSLLVYSGFEARYFWTLNLSCWHLSLWRRPTSNSWRYVEEGWCWLSGLCWRRWQSHVLGSNIYQKLNLDNFFPDWKTKTKIIYIYAHTQKRQNNLIQHFIFHFATHTWHILQSSWKITAFDSLLFYSLSFWPRGIVPNTKQRA